MSYGDEYGEYQFGDGVLAGTIASHLLTQNREGPRFRALVQLFADLAETRIEITETIAAGLDLDTAAGNELDVIGAYLGQPRLGMTDTRYHSVLRVQIVILSSTGATAPGILKIVEAITGAPVFEYYDDPPARFVVGADVEPEDESLLIQLLRRARGGGIGGLLVVADVDSVLLCDSVASPIVSPDPGVLDSVAAPITGAARLAAFAEI